MDSKLYLDRYKANVTASIESLRLGMRATFLLNGGAIIGILTCIGNIFGKQGNTHLFDAFKSGIPWFISGIVFSTLTSITSYFSHEYQLSFNLLRYVSTTIRSELKNIKNDTELYNQLIEADNKAEKNSKSSSRFRNSTLLFFHLSLLFFIIGSYFIYFHL